MAMWQCSALNCLLIASYQIINTLAVDMERIARLVFVGWYSCLHQTVVQFKRTATASLRVLQEQQHHIQMQGASVCTAQIQAYSADRDHNCNEGLQLSVITQKIAVRYAKMVSSCLRLHAKLIYSLLSLNTQAHPNSPADAVAHAKLLSTVTLVYRLLKATRDAINCIAYAEWFSTVMLMCRLLRLTEEAKSDLAHQLWCTGLGGHAERMMFVYTDHDSSSEHTGKCHCICQYLH